MLFFSRTVTLALASTVSAGAAAEVKLQPYFYYSTGSWPEAVAVADLNNDGRQDVILNTSTYSDPENDFKLKVFLQDEFGRLQNPVNYSLGGEYTKRPKSMAVGDLNGDGLQDVAVGFDRSHIEIFLQYTDGTLFKADTITTPLASRIAVADLNGDGLDDIAGIAWGGDDVGVFYQGEMGISQQPEIHYAPHGGYDDMVLGDINADGANDIVVMSGQSFADNLAVVASDGQGGLLPAAFYDLGGSELTKGVTIGDLNSDGRNDVAVTFGGNRPASSVAVFHQGENGLLNTPEIHTSYDIPETILATDMNMDSRDDLLVLHGGWYAMGVYEQNQDGNLASEVLFDMPYASHYNPQGMDTGDINGDGTPDVVVADYNYGLVVLLGQEAEPPVADAGGDQAVNGNALVLLDGSHSSDSDGNIVDYRWTQTSGASVSLNSSGDGFASFVAPTAISGEDQKLEFQLEVEDNDGLVASDVVTVVVKGNLAPIADAGADQTVNSGSAVVLDGSQSRDTDGSIVGYRWSQVSGTPVELQTGTDGSATFVAPIFNGPVKELLEFELEVEDDGGVRAVDRVLVIVEGNAQPIAIAGPEQTVKQGRYVELNATESLDTDGDIVDYQWTQVAGPSVELTGADSAIASFYAPKLKGSDQLRVVFELKVVDNLGAIATDQVAINIVK